jgi:hypothetical protein
MIMSEIQKVYTYIWFTICSAAIIDDNSIQNWSPLMQGQLIMTAVHPSRLPFYQQKT